MTEIKVESKPNQKSWVMIGCMASFVPRDLVLVKPTEKKQQAQVIDINSVKDVFSK